MPWVDTATSMYYVYFLKLVNGQTYTGATQDLNRRYKEHSDGKVFYTKQHLPAVLIGYEAYLHKSDSFRREHYLKSSAGKKLFRQQYRDVLKSDQEVA